MYLLVGLTMLPYFISLGFRFITTTVRNEPVRSIIHFLLVSVSTCAMFRAFCMPRVLCYVWGGVAKKRDSTYNSYRSEPRSFASF